MLFTCPACRASFTPDTARVAGEVRCVQCREVLIDLAEEPRWLLPRTWRISLPPAGFVLGVILLMTFAVKLRNLDHTGLTRWDEGYHAVVAQNVFKHPLHPTFLDVPFRPYDFKKWGENHVWLHKPILPFWQVALSFAVLGVNTFALRLPAALLSTAAAWLTYLLGVRLFDRPTALLAAVLQAINPFLLNLVHGYRFADTIDVALLFWVEVGVFFLVRALQTGSPTDVLLAGAAQGLAFLCKSYLAMIISGIAVAAWLLPICRLARREEMRIGVSHLLALAGMSVLVVSPWIVHVAVEYPREFWHEHAQVWRHLHTNVENWAAPWDRLVFDYLIAIHGDFYTPILVAAIVLLPVALARRQGNLGLVYAWALGVILPHLFAVTKTPSATVLAMPPLLLLLGVLVTQAWRGERWPLVALVGVLAVSLAMPAVVRAPGHGFPPSRSFGAIMWQASWVLDHVGGAILMAATLMALRTLLLGWLPAPASWADRCFHIAVMLFCVGTLGWLGYRTAAAAWAVTSTRLDDPSSVALGQFARNHLPENAVLLCEERKDDERVAIMFYADRTCYAVAPATTDSIARQVLQAGGVPHVVSRRTLNLPLVHEPAMRLPRIYLWQPP